MMPDNPLTPKLNLSPELPPELPSELQKSLRNWMPEVIELSREVGRAILQIYTSTFEVKNKKDNTPVTCADLAANEQIVKKLSALTPDLPVLSEESDEIAYAQRQNWETYWLVDPLDGTRAFIEKSGQFSINIALIHKHYPVLGVVYSPVRQTCYYACAGNGAFRLENNNEAQQLHVREHCPEQPMIAGTQSSRSPALLAYLNNLEQQFQGYGMTFLGSSLKSCLVAEGKADLYIRLGPTSEWDTAAAQCIVEEAGGQITDLQMQRLSYNNKDSLLNPYFFVFGDKTIPWNQFLQP